MARAIQRGWRWVKAIRPLGVIAARLRMAQLEVRGALGSIGRRRGASPPPADVGGERPATAAAVTDAGRPVVDWSPADVLAAAGSRWVCLGEVRAAGRAETQAERLAAYGRGRARLVRSLLGRDGGRLCVWCGGSLTGRLTVEHIISRSAGGSHELENLCLACRPCNKQRGDTDAIDWYLHCRRQGLNPRARVLARRLQALGLIADLAALRALEADRPTHAAPDSPRR